MVQSVDPYPVDGTEPHIEDELVLVIVRVKLVAINVWKTLDVRCVQG